ncbi:MAG TPA: VWA domain-containing protein [Terriglobales bacterium]|nr:VWA domain-containing protein [Terriglobales bacterium]
MDVKLVNVFVSVRDANGRAVPDLKKTDFQLTEDAVPQNIAIFSQESALPLSIVMAVDTSLSTRDNLRFELASAKQFAHDIVNPARHDALAFYQFDEEVKELSPFTADLSRIDRAIGQVTVGGTTSLYDAIYLASRALKKRQGRKVLVVITDGGDTQSSVTYDEAVRAAQQAEALIYSVIIVPIESSPGRNTGGEHALIQISHDTGGQAYYADSTEQLDRVFRQIKEELHTQYLLAYYPKQRLADSEFRKIEVKVGSGSGEQLSAPLSVRHRAGYYTSNTE